MAALIEIQKLLRFDIDYLPGTEERLALVQLVVSGTKDVGLLPFASQYIAQSFIWAALLAQRRFSSDKMVNQISLHTYHAISILRTRLPKPPVPRIDEHPVLSDAQNKPSTKTRGSRGRVPPKTPKVSKGSSCNASAFLKNILISCTLERSTEVCHITYPSVIRRASSGLI